MYKKGMEEGNKAMVEEVQRNLKQKNAYGYVEPYYPLRLPSDIRKVWIVDHPNEAGDLIQGHWVFMVVTPGRWASPSIPPVHPDNGERTSHTVPVIEDKPAAFSDRCPGQDECFSEPVSSNFPMPCGPNTSPWSYELRRRKAGCAGLSW